MSTELPVLRVKRGESECFRINRGVRQRCIMSPWLFNVYMDPVMKEAKMGMGRREESGGCQASCTQVIWFYVELEADLSTMVGCFAEVSRKNEV